MTLHTGLTRMSSGPLDALGSIAIAGESAVLVAAAFTAAGGPPLVLESDHFALLSRAEDVPAVGRVRDLPEGSVDLVVLRRAWSEPRAVGEALRIARDRVVAGGEVIAADLDVPRLLAGPTLRYPGRLFYLAAPAAADRLRTSTATPSTVGAEAVRAGLRRVEVLTYEDVRSSHDGAEGLWEAIRARGWRGADWVPLERRAQVAEEVAASLRSVVPAGPAADREPWYAVAGTVA